MPWYVSFLDIIPSPQVQLYPKKEHILREVKGVLREEEGELEGSWKSHGGCLWVAASS